jgi:hypothetical protein
MKPKTHLNDHISFKNISSFILEKKSAINIEKEVGHQIDTSVGLFSTTVSSKAMVCAVLSVVKCI